MRIAALAFGVLAGLVASLILALGGLDPEAFHALDPRQVSFALFIIANLGVFAAALALAAPLASAILLLLTAAAWAGAAALLGHRADYVLITPPALLAIAAALSILAFVSRPPRSALESSQGAPEFEDEAGPAAAAPLRGLDQADQIRGSDADWQPGKKRSAPPRQEPVFRDPEEEDEESGFSRFLRGLSTVLSFGLYAALAGAAVLIYLNLRTSDVGHTAAVAEAKPSTSSSSATPSSSASSALAPILVAPSSSEPLRGPVLTTATALGTEPTGAPVLRTVGPTPGPAAEAILPPSSSLPSSSGVLSSALAASSAASEQVPVQLKPENLLAESVETSTSFETDPALASSSEEPSAATGQILPFTMPAQMAAAREQPAPPPSEAPRAPAASAGGDTGL